MSFVQGFVINHPTVVKLTVAGFGAWFALTLYSLGTDSSTLRSNWQLATSEALGG